MHGDENARETANSINAFYSQWLEKKIVENCGKFWVVTTEGKLFAKLPVCGYRRIFS